LALALGWMRSQYSISIISISRKLGRKAGM
jgi:hypothetical protein